nr:GIY-YIG nuclease family protein [Halarsenatibacter silvermanii]
MSHYAYMLLCSDDTIYTGYTTDLKRRVREHNAGEGAAYTRGRTPVVLIYWEEFDTRSGAQKREYALKQLSRSEKVALTHPGENHQEDGVRVPE